MRSAIGPAQDESIVDAANSGDAAQTAAAAAEDVDDSDFTIGVAFVVLHRRQYHQHRNLRFV